jgi:5-(hydroxymethyl)furfural/furfural oxidase
MQGPWDVIIVGAGSAGAALAARLSEAPDRRVLLLEAGKDWRAADAPQEVRSANPIPLLRLTHLQEAWQWPGLMSRRTTVQQPRLYWRGRGLGGSSIVNGQIAIRGVPEAFDEWAAGGCEGWGWRDVLPLFRRLEADEAFGEKPYHGADGPLPIYRAPLETWGPVDLASRQAALDLGYPWNDDLNAPEGEGVSCYPINSRNARRVTTNDAYLEPIRSRENLTICGEALVDKVIVRDGRTCGVRVRIEGAWQEIFAPSVVLSSGSVHSPAVLMRSGIGPAEALSRLGIAIVKDMPEVGQNFMDHPILHLTMRLKPEFRLPHPDARHTNCCLTYSSGMPGTGRRDMIMMSFNHLGLPGEPREGAGSLSPALFQAYSRGEVNLVSPRPEDDPFIDERMLSDVRDMVRMRDAAYRVAALAQRPAFERILERATVGESNVVLAEVPHMSEADLDALLLAEVSDIQHGVGACRMTGYGAADGVVDTDCRVKGVPGLYVVDASVMPSDCRANTHLTSVMIGEAMGERFGRPSRGLAA